ncbi:MAG: DUF3795 domain-containing protein [Clostridiales bacterium]|nr:DUF3795 domain-containing protein [Clostridiales bacterium]
MKLWSLCVEDTDWMKSEMVRTNLSLNKGKRQSLRSKFINVTDEMRAIMIPELNKMWGDSDWSMRCEGCYSDNCYCKDDLCKAKRCSQENGSMICKECKDFPCIKATAADWRSMIHTDVHYTDEITWGILHMCRCSMKNQNKDVN